MDTYNPSFINPASQLMNYLSEQDRETARNGYRQALGNPPSAESKLCGTIAGVLFAKLIFDIIDR